MRVHHLNEKKSSGGAGERKEGKKALDGEKNEYHPTLMAHNANENVK